MPLNRSCEEQSFLFDTDCFFDLVINLWFEQFYKKLLDTRLVICLVACEVDWWRYLIVFIGRLLTWTKRLSNIYIYVGLSKITWTVFISFDYTIEFHSNLQDKYSHVICRGLQNFIKIPSSVIILQ